MGKSLASQISLNGLYKPLLENYCFRPRASISGFAIMMYSTKVCNDNIPCLQRAARMCNNAPYLIQVMNMCALSIHQEETSGLKMLIF